MNNVRQGTLRVGAKPTLTTTVSARKSLATSSVGHMTPDTCPRRIPSQPWHNSKPESSTKIIVVKNVFMFFLFLNKETCFMSFYSSMFSLETLVSMHNSYA